MLGSLPLFISLKNSDLSALLRFSKCDCGMGFLSTAVNLPVFHGLDMSGLECVL